MQLNDIQQLVAQEMQAVNQRLHSELNSPVELIEDISDYIISSGGKRLRPMLVVLAAKLFNYQDDTHHDLAVIIEALHSATLLHDDVVDNSSLRRGRQTANQVFGNAASVLVGDFIYTRCFQMLVKIGNPAIMACLASATNKITEGEVLQLSQRHNPNTSEARYLDIITYKTATLFEAATALGAIIACNDQQTIKAISDYGRHLGISFQLVDDCLDFLGDSASLGKNIGDDLAEGKPTLPLIYALENGNDRERQMIKQAIEQGGLNNIDDIIHIIHNTKALAYTQQLAAQHIDQAITKLDKISDSPYRQALISLAKFALERSN